MIMMCEGTTPPTTPAICAARCVVISPASRTSSRISLPAALKLLALRCSICVTAAENSTDRKSATVSSRRTSSEATGWGLSHPVTTTATTRSYVNTGVPTSVEQRDASPERSLKRVSVSRSSMIAPPSGDWEGDTSWRRTVLLLRTTSVGMPTPIGR